VSVVAGTISPTYEKGFASVEDRLSKTLKNLKEAEKIRDIKGTPKH